MSFLLVKEGSEEIIKLHDKLYSGRLLPYEPTDFLFVPHITLGEFKTKDESIYTKAFAEAQSLHVDFTCLFNAVSIIKGDGISPAKIIKTIVLPSEK